MKRSQMLKISFQKLNHNKEETTISLEKQLKTINDSLKETNRMLANARGWIKENA